MKKRGFTLVELLAVIVILAVIALIAVPFIANTIEEARIGAFRDSVLGAYQTVEHKLMLSGLSKIPEDGIDVMTLEVRSDFEGGRFMLDKDGKEIAYLIRNSKYCAYGRLDNLEIRKRCQDLDLSYPNTDDTKMIVTSTTNSIQVILEDGIASDNETGIKNYVITLYLNDKTVQAKTLDTLGSVTFTKLNKNTEYRVETAVVNKNNMKSFITKKVRTGNIDNPGIVFVSEPAIDSHGFTKKQTATVTFEKGSVTNPVYYIQSYKAGTLNKDTKKNCGTGALPENCTNTITKNIEAGVWYEVPDGIEIVYTEPDIVTKDVIALTYDGSNYSGAATGTISKIFYPASKVNYTENGVSNVKEALDELYTRYTK